MRTAINFRLDGEAAGDGFVLLGESAVAGAPGDGMRLDEPCRSIGFDSCARGGEREQGGLGRAGESEGCVARCSKSSTHV